MKREEYEVKDQVYVTQKFNDWLVNVLQKPYSGRLKGLAWWWNDLVFRIGPFRTEEHVPVPDLTPTGYDMPGRWTRLVNDYSADYPDFLASEEVRKMMFYAEGSYIFNQRANHDRGNCLLGATFGFRHRGVETLQMTAISRSSFLTPMGPLDLSLLLHMARDFALAKNSRFYRLQWILSQGQIVAWQSFPWLYYHNLLEKLPEELQENFRILKEEKFNDPALDSSKWSLHRRWRNSFYAIPDKPPFYPVTALSTDYVKKLRDEEKARKQALKDISKEEEE